MPYHINDNLFFSCGTLYKLMPNGDKKYVSIDLYIPTDEAKKRRDLIYEKLRSDLKKMENNQ